MKQYELEKSFANYYKKGIDTLSLRFSVFDGFPDVSSAHEAVKQIGQQPDLFLYITFKEQVYAVAMETLAHQLVIGSEMIYYRDSNHPVEKVGRIPFDEYETIGFVIEKPRIGSSWTDTLKRDLETLNGMPLQVEGAKSARGRYLLDNSIVLMGIAFFDTMIPVYQLNVMDSYFAFPPSRMKLWEKGVKAYNPYTQEKTYGKNAPYTLEVYKKECQKEEATPR